MKTEPESSNPDKPKKKGGSINKIIMGAVIGGAIGSVVGASVRKKKDQNKSVEIKINDPNKKGIISKLKNLFTRKKKD